MAALCEQDMSKNYMQCIWQIFALPKTYSLSILILNKFNYCYVGTVSKKRQTPAVISLTEPKIEGRTCFVPTPTVLSKIVEGVGLIGERV